MFVAMGSSAIFPVLHGIEMYGVDSMRERIGLTWLVLQGVLYITGAGLYAVSDPSLVINLRVTNSIRLVGPRDRHQAHMIFGAVRIKSFMCW